jgi:hypothetical protein
MAKLSFVLRDKSVRRMIRNQESRPAILLEIGRAEQQLVTTDSRGLLPAARDGHS